jgi:hypothetical protein
MKKKMTLKEYFETKRKSTKELYESKQSDPVLGAYMSGCRWMVDEIEEDITTIYEIEELKQ